MHVSFSSSSSSISSCCSFPHDPLGCAEEPYVFNCKHAWHGTSSSSMSSILFVRLTGADPFRGRASSHCVKAWEAGLIDLVGCCCQCANVELVQCSSFELPGWPQQFWRQASRQGGSEGEREMTVGVGRFTGPWLRRCCSLALALLLSCLALHPSSHWALGKGKGKEHCYYVPLGLPMLIYPHSTLFCISTITLTKYNSYCYYTCGSCTCE